MEINGLPLHPLVVHAAVVLGPIGAVTAILYAAVARWRDRLRLPMVVLAVVATGSVLAAYLSGNDLLSSRPELAQQPALGVHTERAELLLRLTLAYGSVALLVGWLHGRTAAAAQLLMRTGLGLLALAVLVQVVRTGDAGTRAVWGDF